MSTWGNIVELEGSVKIGTTQVKLEHSLCGRQECNLGNFYTDAVLHKVGVMCYHEYFCLIHHMVENFYRFAKVRFVSYIISTVLC